MVSKMFVETFRGAEKNHQLVGNKNSTAETLNSHDAQFRDADKTPGEILPETITRAPSPKNFSSCSWRMLLNRIYT